MITDKPDIVLTLQAEGIEIRRNMAQCPFHDDRHPSMRIRNGKYRCFACGVSGDVITFIQEYRGLSFPDALSYLGISSSNKKVRLDPKVARKKELVIRYEAWKTIYMNYLCDVLRKLDNLKMTATNMKTVETLAWAYHREPLWEHHFEIMLGRDEELKLEIFKNYKITARVKHGIDKAGIRRRINKNRHQN